MNAKAAPAVRVPCDACERERNLRLAAEASKAILERERTAHLQFLAEHNFGAFDALRKNAELWRRQYSQALARAEEAEAKLSARQKGHRRRGRTPRAPDRGGAQPPEGTT